MPRRCLCGDTTILARSADARVSPSRERTLARATLARDAHFPPGTAIARARAAPRARGRQKSTRMFFGVFLVFAFGCGAKANTYTNRDDLKDAVDACLIDDATGQSCNMNSWDVSAVASMHSVFRFKAAFDAIISAWDTSSVTNMGQHVSGGDSVQRGHLWVEHQLCDNHGKHVSRGDIVQRRHQWVGHQLCDGDRMDVLGGDSV